MQPIGSMLRRTSHHVRRQRELFALRARRAGTSFVGETRDAGLDLASAVRGEADAWGKYLQETATVFTGAIAPHTLQRTLLERASHALRALDARLRGRIHALEGAKRARVRVKTVNGATKPRAKRQAASARAH